MNLEKAILTAIDFEHKVRAVYADAARKTKDEKGRHIFEVLAQEEQTHVDFLEERLAEWRASGKVTPQKLATVVPPQDKIKKGIKSLKHRVRDEADHNVDIDLLKRALGVEKETGDFYQRMANELDPQGQALFAPFVEIEQGHYAIVQSQIDALNGFGYWFDFMEFDLEAG